MAPPPVGRPLQNCRVSPVNGGNVRRTKGGRCGTIKQKTPRTRVLQGSPREGIKALLSVFLNLHINDVRLFAQSNTGITIISRETVNAEPSFGLDMLNSTEHLQS